MADRILVTSALPYINGVKHLGNLAGSLLPADVYARFQRLRGRDVLFVCGTDEHGTPAELAAATAGLPVDAYCAQQHTVQADIYRRFNLSFDHFSRTSSPRSHALTQHLYERLDANGLIEERVTPQIWSPRDGRYLPDRYVLGTCPHCGFENARGDQCDGCSSLLDPAELIAPRSAISGATDLETRGSRHLFLRQSALADRLRAWHATRDEWDPLVCSIAAKWLDEGLQDRCITRDLAWGVPVPRRGFEGKVFYVWFDAPIGYIAAVQEWAEQAPGRDWRDWWRPGEGVRYVQFLGKDNAPFHTVSFPATLIGAGGEFRLVDRIKCFDWLNWGGSKFSTSAGRGLFTDAALDELPADWWRWWLTANAPEGSDVRFDVTGFAAGANADLADTIGNYANRVLHFTASRFEGRIPAAAPDTAIADEVRALLDRCAADFEAIRLRKAASGLRALWALGNAYVTREAPWSNPDRAAGVTRTALELLRIAAQAAAAVIPDTANRILAALGEPAAAAWPDAALDRLRESRLISPLRPLFPKITAERIIELDQRYAGSPSLD